MLRKIFLRFWSMRHQFARYFVIGFSGVILDVGSLYLLKEFLHLRPVVAVVINGIFLLNYIFFLNKHWAFKSQGVTHKQMVRFFILAGFNYAISVTWMYIFNHIFGFNYLLVRIANIALSVAWNFLLYKYWVYKYEADFRLQTTDFGLGQTTEDQSRKSEVQTERPLTKFKF